MIFEVGFTNFYKAGYNSIKPESFCQVGLVSVVMLRFSLISVGAGIDDCPKSAIRGSFETQNQRNHSLWNGFAEIPNELS